MIRLLVLYGHPLDPTAFDRYYQEAHIPIARRMKGLTGWTIGKCESAMPGEEPNPFSLNLRVIRIAVALDAVRAQA